MVARCDSRDRARRAADRGTGPAAQTPAPAVRGDDRDAGVGAGRGRRPARLADQDAARDAPRPPAEQRRRAGTEEATEEPGPPAPPARPDPARAARTAGRVLPPGPR